MWNPLPKVTGTSTGSAATPTIGGLASPGPQTATAAYSYAATTPSQPSTGYYSNIQWIPAAPSASATESSRAQMPKDETVEEIVLKHEQDLLDKIVTETETETRTKIDQSLEYQVNQMWEQDRSAWVQELIGFRKLGSSADAPLAIGAGPGVPALTDGGTTPALALPASSSSAATSIGWSQTQSLVLGRGNREGFLDPDFVNAHWNIIRNPSTPIFTAEALKNLVSAEITKGGRQSPILSGYSTALDWIKTLLEMGVKSSPVDQATATLVHLARQFEGIISMRVQEALGSGQVAENASFNEEGARSCSLYAQLMLGGQTVWNVLFYCLRIGDSKAALEVWTQMGDPRLTDAQQNAISGILSAMNQANVKCFWEMGIPPLPVTERQVLADMMDRQDTSSDIHCRGVIALLSGLHVLPGSDSTPGFTSIEDYLYGHLWKALLSNEPQDELHNFGNEILKLGAMYFQDEESAGWSYALPLLVSQQYARAFIHLAESGKDVLLQAAHLTLLLASGGIQISNLGETTPNRHLVAAIVEAYASLLRVGAGPLAALDYIIRIPEKDLACKEVSKLIATTGDISTLVGTIDADGVRRVEGPLDQHLSPKQIQQVLKDAAELSLRNRNDAGKVMTACWCYLTGGSYSSAVALLVDMISPPDKRDENRLYWIEQTCHFDKDYLEKRSHVYNQLEREGKLNLVEALRTLVKLNRFFENLEAGHFREAWKIIAAADLIPLTPADQVRHEVGYRQKHEKIRSCYPRVLLGAMKILNKQHTLSKKEMRGGAADVAKQNLASLQAQAGSIVTFAGLIDVAPSQKEGLSHMQALMI